MSYGSPSPLWPLPTPPKAWTSAGSFSAKRPSSATFTRHHQGVDLYAAKGTAVYAMEDGIVVGDQGWDGPGTRAVFVESKGTSIRLLYGAVAPGSYPAKGTVVKRGQQIATIGVYPKGSTMLHIEAWDSGAKFALPRPAWKAGAVKPSELYDISEYLERAKQNPNGGGGGGNGGGGDQVTASSDPFLDPLRGDLTYEHPCSVFGDVEICQPTNTVAWRASLQRELDACVPQYNAFNALVAAAKAKWGSPASDMNKAYDAMQVGFKAYDEWGSLNSLPSNAVEALKAAAAAVRSATKTFAAALAAKAPVDATENEDSGGAGNGNDSGNGQNQPKPPSSGSGLAIAAAGLGIGAYFLLA